MQTRDVLHDWQYEDNVKLIILNTLHSLATHAPYYFGYRPFSIHQQKDIVHVALPLPLRIKIWKGKWSSLDVGGGGNNKVLLDKIETIITVEELAGSDPVKPSLGRWRHTWIRQGFSFILNFGRNAVENDDDQKQKIVTLSKLFSKMYLQIILILILKRKLPCIWLYLQSSRKVCDGLSRSTTYNNNINNN